MEDLLKDNSKIILDLSTKEWHFKKDAEFELEEGKGEETLDELKDMNNGFKWENLKFFV